MLRNLKLPKNLRTIHRPGRKVEIWIDIRKVERINDFSHRDQVFLKQFILNLEEKGWIVSV